MKIYWIYIFQAFKNQGGDDPPQKKSRGGHVPPVPPGIAAYGCCYVAQTLDKLSGCQEQQLLKWYTVHVCITLVNRCIVSLSCQYPIYGTVELSEIQFSSKLNWNESIIRLNFIFTVVLPRRQNKVVQYFAKHLISFLNTTCYHEVWRWDQIRNHNWTIPLNF